MENLPLEIEQKLENLPVIPFDGGEEFQTLIMSKDFTDIFEYYRDNYLPDILKTKPEIYQRVSLYLTLTNQSENFTEQTDQVLYRRPVPNIDDFLTNNYYMGYLNSTLYPYWREQLSKLFAEGSPVRKAIFSGCIGCGKSTVARKVFVYVLYRMLCVRYPRAILGVDNDSTLASIIISMTLKQVYDTNLLPVVKLMEGMPCFQKVMSTRSFENFDLSNPRCPFPFTVEKSSGTIFFPDNIIVTCGSNQGHFTGYNVFNSFCLAGNTEIHTTSGDIQIAELTDKFGKGEKIFTYDLDGSEVEIVNAKQTDLAQDTIKIWFDDKNFIECTPNHKFLIKNPKEKDFYVVYIHGLPFKEARYLTEEDEIEELNMLYPVKN